MANPELRKLEQQFAAMAMKKRCRTCSQRTSRCPECRNLVGFTAREVEDGSKEMITRIEAMAARLPPHDCWAVATDAMSDDELAEHLAKAMARGVGTSK